MSQSTKSPPRSNVRPVVTLEFQTVKDRDAFVETLIHVEQDAAPPKGSRVLTSEQALRRIFLWRVGQ